MRPYEILEQKVDTFRGCMKRLIDAAAAASRELTSGEETEFHNLNVEVEDLAAQAVELRNQERDDLTALIERASAVPDPEDEDTGWRDFALYGIPGDLEYMPGSPVPPEKRAQIAGSDPAGGYLVPEPQHLEIIEKVRTVNGIAANARVIPMTGDTSVLIPKVTGHAATSRATETQARTEQTAPTYGMVKLSANDMYTDIRTTQTLLDSVPGHEQDVLDDIAGSLGEAFGVETVSGTGAEGQAQGVFTNLTGDNAYTIKVSTTDNNLDAAQLLNSFFTLPSKYLGNAKYYGTGATAAALAGFVFPNTQTPMLQFTPDGTAKLLGKPYVQCDSAPAIGNGLYPLAFGDMNAAYIIGIHRNQTVLRDPYTNKPYVVFYVVTRIGGTPRDNQALHILKSDT